MSEAQPPSPEPGPRRSIGARVAAGVTIGALVLVGGGYVAGTALAEAPDPTLELVVDETAEFSVDDAAVQRAVDAEALPSAVGWLDGTEVWANDTEAHPLASITKLVTVLVGQQQDPLTVGSDGPSYTWTERDVKFQESLVALDGIAFPIPAGTEVTRREMITLAMLPSANDFATSYAHSLFGDNQKFSAAVDAFAAEHGLDSLKIYEPSGLDKRNEASASDVVKIARLVLADPALAEIVRMPSATIGHGIGEITSTNPLFGMMPDVIGIKTGHIEAAGYNLAAAARSDFEGRELTRIAVVFGRESDDARAVDARRLLTELVKVPEQIAVARTGEHLGTLTSADGQVIDLTSAGSADVVLVPGEAATRTIEIGDAATQDSIRVTALTGDTTVEVERSGSFADPGLWWKLTHPGILFR